MNMKQQEEMENSYQILKPTLSRNCQVCSTKFALKKLWSKKKTCSSECMYIQRSLGTKVEKNCEYCAKSFLAISRARFCSDKCCGDARLKAKNIGIEGVDYIVCPLCNSHVKQISAKHAKMHGYDTAKEMKEALGMAEITCQTKKETSQGENNPGYQHGGKFSPWSKNFVNGYDEEKHNQMLEKNKEIRKNNPELFKNNVEYWIKQCDGDVEKGTIEYKKFQSKNLDFFITHYGEEEGQRRHASKTEKWTKSFKKQNYSKISQKLFDEIVKHLSSTEHIYYATFERDDMTKYKNKEYILHLPTTSFRLDFTDVNQKKIIEFDGAYWHGVGCKNLEKQALREQMILDQGYKIFHVPEDEYKKDPAGIVQQCLNFLKP